MNIPLRHCLDSATAFAGHNQTGPPSVWVRADSCRYFLDLEIRFLRHLPHSVYCPKSLCWLPVPGLSTAQMTGPPPHAWCPKKARLRYRRHRIPPEVPLAPCCVEYSQLCRLNRPNRNHLRPYHRKPKSGIRDCVKICTKLWEDASLIYKKKRRLDRASIVSFLKPRNLRRPPWWDHFAVTPQFVNVLIKHRWLG